MTMADSASSSEDAAAARAAKQARLRKQRREAKLRDDKQSRLDKITGLGGGVSRESPAQPPASTESSPSKPAVASPDSHPDPDEVDISQHYYAPQTTARPPPPDPANISEAQLRQMMLGFDRPSPGNPFLNRRSPTDSTDGSQDATAGNEDQLLRMIQGMIGGQLPNGGTPGASEFPGMGGLDALLRATAGSNTTMPQQQQQQGQAAEWRTTANLWRILHAIFALGLGIYVALSTTFTGTKVERDADDLQSTGVLGARDIQQARAWFFYVFTSVEAVLLTSRYAVEQGAGFTPAGWTWSVANMLPQPFGSYARYALRYGQLFTTVRNDALFCVFVMGVCSLLRS
ncbi:hypothetical protein F5Y14DRAFT_426248 [Nemania sp. NC0429]|nr:hypothetical protein F5Y14DRAFT_426248 [Nemania sp. NC0429]